MAFNLQWDQTGERYYETGTDRGVLYTKGTYDGSEAWLGTVWNGLTGVTESPSGASGILLGQQPRKSFGFSYRSDIGSDEDSSMDTDSDYKIHIIYGCTASPSEKAYQTINESPEAITFSWEVTTTPVTVDGFKPVASITIDTRRAPTAFVTALEQYLYGTPEVTGTNATPAVPARLPRPDKILELYTESQNL